MIVALRAPSLAKFGEVDTVPGSEKCDNPRMTQYDSYYMYGYTQNTGATRSQCSLDISATFRVSYKAMTLKKILDSKKILDYKKILECKIKQSRRQKNNFD